MNLEFRCKHCGKEMEFFYDPNVSDKQHIETVLVGRCSCVKKSIENARFAGYENGYTDYQNGNLWT